MDFKIISDHGDKLQVAWLFKTRLRQFSQTRHFKRVSANLWVGYDWLGINQIHLKLTPEGWRISG